MPDTRLGFKYEYRMGGGTATVQKFLFKDTETIRKGDLVNLETGKVDLAATNDTALLGVALITVAGTADVSFMECITDDDAVYSVYDANARAAGATLDFAGASGAYALAASSNVDLIVMATSTAAERTYVRIVPNEHAFK